MHLHRFQAAVAALLALLVATVASAALPDVATTDSTDSKNCPDLLRIEFALIRKPPDISYDYFYDYWLNYHGPKIVVPWALKYNFTTYTQIHTRPELKKKLAPAQTLPYDGLVEFEVTDFKLFEKAQADPYVTNVIIPDTLNFIDQSPTGVVRTNATTTIGSIKYLIKDGRALKRP